MQVKLGEGATEEGVGACFIGCGALSVAAGSCGKPSREEGCTSGFALLVSASLGRPLGLPVGFFVETLRFFVAGWAGSVAGSSLRDSPVAMAGADPS